MDPARTALLTLALLALAGPSRAEVIAGVCPDGSAFIVHSRDDAPCERAKFVAPSDLPPLHPEMLPHPYGLEADQRVSDPHNPYNLIPGTEPAGTAEATATAAAVPEPVAVAPSPPPPALALDESEIRDLVRIVVLRQQVAPAAFTVEDALGREELQLRLAHSHAFESRVRDELGATDRRVILFSARGLRDTEFHPNFLVVSGAATFRPDPADPRDVGFIVGSPGPLAEGYLALGYIAVPTRFDPARELEVWWNDRSLMATLEP